ncbi:MAG: transcription termination factor Rho [Bacteroidaceae bacterium]|nr:transcription termination factor Rho [Prevotellaceae bacterium]MDY5632830.1 transcription termination factor Rho [Bacteroidaceae bacterium]
MHTKSELESMDPMELVELCKKIGAQVTEDIPSLIYNIIDRESELESQQQPEPEKKRRGRPRKSDVETEKAEKATATTKRKKSASPQSQVSSNEENTPEAEDSTEQTEGKPLAKPAEAPKKKRGRPSKTEAETPPAIEQAQEEAQDSNNETKSTNPVASSADNNEEESDFIILEDVPVINMQDTEEPAESEERLQAAPDMEEVVEKQGPRRPQPMVEKFDFVDLITSEGVLEVMNEGFGFLRSSDYNYLSSPDDVFVPQAMVRSLGLKTGDVIKGAIRPPRENDHYFVLTSILRVNGCDPNIARDRSPFEHLTPLFPEEKFTLCKGDGSDSISSRVVDLFSPIGKGQRALIVAQPKTGKTMLMKDIANSIARNHPEAYLMMLLIDERPEEVTDMARTVNAEVIASTFDEPAERHVKIANIVLEKAKRMVECGQDVVIFLDSITRLARAYNTVTPASGKVLTGGVDANAMHKPKRFFGAARNIENGGSLTIIATALTDTGSKMDEVIFEEFKGTGNMELQLDRTLANKRIFPAVNIVASSTRRDDLLMDKSTLDRMWMLRKVLSDMNPIEAMNELNNRMARTRNNEEFLLTLNS